MFALRTQSTKEIYGLVLHIGSGSVAASIVHSNPEENMPNILWSRREYVLIKEDPSLHTVQKELLTSLVNIFLQINNEGLKTLRSVDTSATINHVYAHVTAPWTYTATKTITFTNETLFEVNENLLEKLAETAERQIYANIQENPILQASQLEIIDTKSVGVTINGYTIRTIENVRSKEVTMTHITTLCEKKIIEALKDSLNKLFPRATTQIHGSMYMLYTFIQSLYSDISELAILDISSEATELGIVREGILTHVNHIPFGTYSIAREIAAVCNIPQEEAYIYLKGGRSFVDTKLSPNKKSEIDMIIQAYKDKLLQLMKSTGDTLAIPNTIFFHTDRENQNFYQDVLEDTVSKVSPVGHTIHPLTALINNNIDKHPKHTPILLPALLFHNSLTHHKST